MSDSTSNASGLTHKRSKSGAIASKGKSLLHRVTSRTETSTLSHPGDDSFSSNTELSTPREKPEAEAVAEADAKADADESDATANLSQIPTDTTMPSTGESLTPIATKASARDSVNLGASNSRPHLATTMTNTNADALAASPSSTRRLSSPPHDHVASSTSPVGPSTSIEQSVRLFKVFEALRHGDTAAISKALREADTSKLEGTTVLHLAVQCAEPSVVEYVLSMAGPGADVNARDKDGNTSLHTASLLGRTGIVKLLLDQKGINESTTNYQGKTALDLARNPDVYSYLQLAQSIYVDEAVRHIQELVRSHNYKDLETMLADEHTRAVVDVDSPELAMDPATVETGGTLLHEATRSRDTRLIQLLLLNGADPFRRDRKGKLPQDITKDDRVKQILKKSPAAAAAQRGIQEKAILTPAIGAPGQVRAENALSSKEAREIKGYLKKWTNYTSGWKLRFFVLEDGVLSYYKHQDDAGSACRGAINMKIAKLQMDPKEKLSFEIQGKSSVKYHLKANHEVEAKRWFWALNNAIQWAKDEAREENRRQQAESDKIKEARHEQHEKHQSRQSTDMPLRASVTPNRTSIIGASLAPTATTNTTTTSEYTTLNNSTSSAIGESSMYDNASAEEPSRSMMRSTTFGDSDNDDDEDNSQYNSQPANKDAFNITAQSAKLQLDLLASLSSALATERQANPAATLSTAEVESALQSYDAAVTNLKGLFMDLLKIHKDHDAYWQYRLDREANVRRLWEESMAKVAREQEQLEQQIGESEDKRKRTKRALREALEGGGTISGAATTQMRSRRGTQPAVAAAGSATLINAVKSIEVDRDGRAVEEETSVLQTGPVPRVSLAQLTNEELSDDDSDMEDEFFDAVDAGEVEVVGELPQLSSPPATPGAPAVNVEGGDGQEDETGQVAIRSKENEIAKSYKGYEDGIRTKLPLDADNRPKISLWGILKNMIGKDMTKMTLPVSFNEPTSLLYRVVEDMQYTDLLEIAADRTDSSERMVYVTAFAASEYASTIGRVAKPFNPLLGETYEYVRPDKGYRFFIEQVSHHPPIGAAYAEAARWDYYGESSVKSKFYGKSFDINPLGTWFLRLRPTGVTNPDGSQYEELYTWRKVTSSVIGIITGNPTVDNYGPMEIKNWTTGESCVLDFKARGWKASSAYQVSGRVTEGNGQTKWSIGGRWNDKIYARLTPGYEGEVGEKDAKEGKAFKIWEADPRPTGIPFNLTPFVVTLNNLPERLRPVIAPTDSRLRPDQRAMEDGKYDLAATEKERVENLQRKRRRAREEKGEEFVPKWFSLDTDKVTGEKYWKFNGEYWKIRDKVANGEDTWEKQRLEEIY
ncbi:hypothetical protein AAFC00_000722 [Neodothiora populina]|uniref:PH domain-containing protein n=1 Tax=Neodothiora populina TaxID=2781224 RepID=A0ABR3PDV5_9PEZI